MYCDGSHITDRRHNQTDIGSTVPIIANRKMPCEISGRHYQALDEHTATLNLGPLPGTAGLSMTFAYAVAPPWNFASIAVDITMVP